MLRIYYCFIYIHKTNKRLVWYCESIIKLYDTKLENIVFFYTIITKKLDLCIETKDY